MTEKRINVYEFAFYSLQVDKIKMFVNNYEKFRKKLSGMNGFKELTTFQSIDDETMVLDLCQWRSIENAKKADDIVQSDSHFRQLLEPLSQVIFFDNMVLNKNFKKEEVTKESLAELNVYLIDPLSREKYNKYRNLFYLEVVENAKGFQMAKTFCSVEDEKANIDLLFWTSKDLADKAHRQLNNNEYFQKMKSCVRELKVWKQMKLFGDNISEGING